DGKAERFRFEHTLYSGQELRELMNWAGLADVSLYGGLDGRPYGPGAERLVAVGRKSRRDEVTAARWSRPRHPTNCDWCRRAPRRTRRPDRPGGPGRRRGRRRWPRCIARPRR